eukprot:Skav226869  [mRNA]  locus=scaffold1187:109043:109357:+ [translate_table: standard]
MQNLSSQDSAALILDFVKSKLSKTDITGGEELVRSLEEEASTGQVRLPSVSPRDRRHLRKTLARMNVYSLLAVFTSLASQYNEEDRVRVERVFSLVRTIRKQLV